MTKTYADMIGLRQLLYICKAEAEKTHLNDKVVIWAVNEVLQTNYKR